MSCILSFGDLPVELYWLFNGDLILNDREDITILKSGKRISVLSIESVRANHAGNYSCLAKNNAGDSEYSTELLVIGE